MSPRKSIIAATLAITSIWRLSPCGGSKRKGRRADRFRRKDNGLRNRVSRPWSHRFRQACQCPDRPKDNFAPAAFYCQRVAILLLHLAQAEVAGLMPAKKSHLISELKALEIPCRFGSPFGLRVEMIRSRAKNVVPIDYETRCVIEQVDVQPSGSFADDEVMDAPLRVGRLLDSRILVGPPGRASIHPFEILGPVPDESGAISGLTRRKTIFVIRSSSCAVARAQMHVTARMNVS